MRIDKKSAGASNLKLRRALVLERLGLIKIPAA